MIMLDEVSIRWQSSSESSILGTARVYDALEATFHLSTQYLLTSTSSVTPPLISSLSPVTSYPQLPKCLSLCLSGASTKIPSLKEFGSWYPRMLHVQLIGRFPSNLDGYANVDMRRTTLPLASFFLPDIVARV